MNGLKKVREKDVFGTGFFGLFSHDLNIGADAFYQSLQGASRTKLYELGSTIFDHLAHGLRPSNGTGELGEQILPYFLRVGGGQGRDILIDGASGHAERTLTDGLSQFLLRGLHERRVERATHIEYHHP